MRILTVPVVAEGRVSGAVQVGTSLLASRQSIVQTIVIFLLTGILGIVPAGFGSFFLAHRALRPIQFAFDRQRRFIADASHYLRTPVAVVRARTDYLARNAAARPPEEQASSCSSSATPNWVIRGTKTAILNSESGDLVRKGGLCTCFHESVHRSPPAAALICDSWGAFWCEFAIVR